MTKLAAKQNDTITATDMHMVQMPDDGTPELLPHSFSGGLNQGLSGSVYINGQAAAVVGSSGQNATPHAPTPPGIAFVNPPSNTGTVTGGSATVFIGGQAAARAGDSATTCADPSPNTSATVVVNGGNVYIG